MVKYLGYYWPISIPTQENPWKSVGKTSGISQKNVRSISEFVPGKSLVQHPDGLIPHVASTKQEINQ